MRVCVYMYAWRIQELCDVYVYFIRPNVIRAAFLIDNYFNSFGFPNTTSSSVYAAAVLKYFNIIYTRDDNIMYNNTRSIFHNSACRHGYPSITKITTNTKTILYNIIRRV